jgi:minor extracellular serine protease Vpr
VYIGYFGQKTEDQLTRFFYFRSAHWQSLAFLLIGTLAFSSFGQAQTATNRYAVFLQAEPVVKHFSSRAEIQSAEASGYRQQIEAAQLAVRNQLSAKNIQITGSASTVLNAIFVIAPAGRVAEIAGIPGVAAVVPLRRRKLLLNKATTLMNGPQAWNLSGGLANAGQGLKIGILDTGVDQNHPALKDSSLPVPAGFPKCNNPPDFNCSDFTNSKVIVAKSYIRQLAAGSDPNNPAADSRPDDYTPRDHVGHGTATASSAAGNTATGAVIINGMAPKAYIGNYRILGSPTVNDGTFDDIMVLALEDAINDGMDVISLSVGGPAFTGPLDTGAACGVAANVPCDVAASAFDTAAQKVPIIVAAGNDGDSVESVSYLNFNSIESPGDAPSVIAAGATTNAHYFVSTVSLTGSGVPSNLSTISAQVSDSAAPDIPLTAALADITQLGDNGLGCAALPAGSLAGSIALIQRGTCNFSVKMANAVAAGALGVIFYMADSTQPISPGGLTTFTQPAVMISRTDGINLKAFIDAHAAFPATLSPLVEQTAPPNEFASFTSMGPTVGTSAIKPDLLATGTDMYMPTQSYDPLGEMYSPGGFTVAAGTSFATPLIAGAAALVKQNHPAYSPAQIKSVLVNSAAQDVTTDDFGDSVNILQTGSGRLTADAAIQANITFSPATISFGILTAMSLPATKPIQITNSGSTAVNLSLAVAQTSSASGTTLTLDKATLALAPGASATVNLTLAGTLPLAGVYSGAVSIQGGAVSLRVPYLYLVGQAAASNLFVLSGDGDDSTVGQIIPDGEMAFKLTDDNGVPVAGAPVTFTAANGVTLSQVSTTTNVYGIASAVATLGPTAGDYSVFACAAATCSTRPTGLYWQFTGSARLAPSITAAGVVDAASFKQPIAPGSYVAIFGSNLFDPALSASGSTTSDQATTARLPLALDYVQVSFDVPSAKISVPARMYYVSAGQLVVQVPWELQGQTSAQVKVTIDFTYGNVVTIPISNYAPAFFESSGVAIGTDLTNNLITAANPAVRGQTITLYANGLGPVNNQPASGDPAPSSPLATTTSIPAVTIGNQLAEVKFSGLTPTLPGLYQLNVAVPANISTGSQPISISIGGQTSRASTIPIR